MHLRTFITSIAHLSIMHLYFPVGYNMSTCCILDILNQGICIDIKTRFKIGKLLKHSIAHVRIKHSAIMFHEPNGIISSSKVAKRFNFDH